MRLLYVACKQANGTCLTISSLRRVICFQSLHRGTLNHEGSAAEANERHIRLRLGLLWGRGARNGFVLQRRFRSGVDVLFKMGDNRVRVAQSVRETQVGVSEY
jgi:hypothetical protein